MAGKGRLARGEKFLTPPGLLGRKGKARDTGRVFWALLGMFSSTMSYINNAKY